MQNLWAFLGACAGLFSGVTKEGIDLFLSLRSVQGWKELYAGTAASASKKVDEGDGTPTHPVAQKPTQSGQAAVKQFFGTRPPETITAQYSPTPYSSFPILGGQPAAPVPAPAAATSGLSPARQSGAVPPMKAPMPFDMPAGTNRADSLPDIFGATSMMGGKPAGQPAPAFEPSPTPAAAPAAVASPDKGLVLNGSPNGYAGSEEVYGSSADEGSSPEVNTRTDSKMKILKKRISSKLRGTKA